MTEYHATTLAISAATATLFILHVWICAEAYHIWHDDRAAVDLAIAVCLLIAAVGAAVSAFANIIADDALGIAGRSFVRASLLLIGLVVVMVRLDKRRQPPPS